MTAARPASPTATTRPDTARSACSATPINPHSSCRVAPGRMAINGSPRYSFTNRCTWKTAAREVRPTSAAVTAFGRQVELARLRAA